MDWLEESGSGESDTSGAFCVGPTACRSGTRKMTR